MKTLLKILLVISLLASSSAISFWFWDTDKPNIPYEQNCEWDDCLAEWIKTTSWIWAIETKRKASEYVQDIVTYLITFLTLIAVIYIIYAWFNILTWAWEEEKAKKSKTIIIYVIVWVALVWLAFPITKFIFQVLGWPTWS